MEPALRRGDRDGVGGGSRIVFVLSAVCPHAHFMSASAAARMNEIELEIERCRLRRHVWHLFGSTSELLVSYLPLANDQGTRFAA